MSKEPTGHLIATVEMRSQISFKDFAGGIVGYIPEEKKMRREVVEAAKAIWDAAVAPGVHVAGAEEEQVGRIAEIIGEHVDGLRIPLEWIEIRESDDFNSGGTRLMATIHFAVATILPREALQDCADTVAQAVLVERTKGNLARELSEHPFAHRVKTGDVVAYVDLAEIMK